MELIISSTARDTSSINTGWNFVEPSPKSGTKKEALNIGKSLFVKISPPPIINIAEKTPISPLTSEQLTLFEKDNIIVNVDKSFQNLHINPQDTLQILKNIVVN